MRIVYTNAFKKDLKRYKNNPKRREKIAKAVELLASGGAIPINMEPHKLKGEYKGFREFHIEGDLLLIWREVNEQGEEIIYLVRLGSHSELFD